MFLILVGGFKLVESAFGADWIRLADYRLIMMLALAVLHVLIGWVKARREEDRYRARFL